MLIGRLQRISRRAFVCLFIKEVLMRPVSMVPYTNMHQLNLDWVVQKVQSLEEQFNDSVEDEIRRVLKDAFVNIVYDSGDKSIRFNIDIRGV